jgi:Tfp pilus assembly protein PilF
MPHAHATLTALSITCMAIAACGGQPLTFTRDVAPIVFARCAGCHRPGGGAPFALLTYHDVRQRARTIVEVTGKRYMPPWLPAPGHGEFAGERRLADAEIEILRRWVEQGAVEGAASDLPAAPRADDGWQMGEPDLVVELPQPYTLPPSSGDVWRNFVIPVTIDRPVFVRTLELHPGGAGVIHHALVGVDATRASRRRDERDAEPGFAGMDMGDAQAPDGHLLGWTPGMAPYPGVPGKAWRLDPGSDLVLQLHILPSGRAETIKPAVGLYLADAAGTAPPMSLIRLDADHLLDIPAGEANHTVTDTLTLPVDVEVLAVYPHAHYLATRIESRAALPDGSVRPLIKIDRWDFKWQDVYRYARPLHLPRGTVVSMAFTFDNSAENPRNPSHPPRRVVAGLKSTDEMAHLQLQVLARTAEDALRLREGMYRHAIAKRPDDAWAYYELGNVARDLGDAAAAIGHYRAALQRDGAHAAAHNNLGVLLVDEGDRRQGIAHFRAALDAEPDLADARFNLANALRSAGDLAGAAAQYREALRLDPGFGEASSNFGELLASQGRAREAIGYFERAIAARPDSAEAYNNLGAAYGQLGKLDEAIRYFELALSRDANHRRAQENLRLAKAASGAR